MSISNILEYFFIVLFIRLISNQFIVSDTTADSTIDNSKLDTLNSIFSIVFLTVNLLNLEYKFSFLFSFLQDIVLKIIS
jgi:hypothetical protein